MTDHPDLASPSTALENAVEESKSEARDLESPGGQPTDDEPSDASYWFERAERLDRERADWKRWCEEREATIERLERERDEARETLAQACDAWERLKQPAHPHTAEPFCEMNNLMRKAGT